MNRFSIYARLKQFIASISFKLFLWSSDLTDEEYWNEIYEQEKRTKVPVRRYVCTKCGYVDVDGIKDTLEKINKISN